MENKCSSKKKKESNDVNLFVKNNEALTTGRSFPIPVTVKNLDNLAKGTLNYVGKEINDIKFHHEIPLDTIAIAVKGDTYIVASNLKSRTPVDIREPNPKENVRVNNAPGIGGTSRVNYDEFSFHSKKNVDKVVDSIKNSDLYKDNPKKIVVVESSKPPSGSMLEKAQMNAKDHAEMKILSKGEPEKMGISKEACENCFKKLQNVQTNGIKGNKQVSNWKDTDEMETEEVYQEAPNMQGNRYKVSYLGTHNVELTKEALVSNAKKKVQSSYRPAISVGVVSGITKIKDIYKNKDYDTFADASTKARRAGICKGVLDKSDIAYANASVFEAKVGCGSLAAASASVLSASAHVETGWNNSIGLDASLIKVQGNAGPINVGLGLNLDTNLGIGLNGINGSFLGTGFSFGPQIGIKTPFFDISIRLF